MLRTFAVANYRSLRDLKLELEPLTIVTGANGTGKSNLYRALRLLAHSAEGRLAEALATKGGIPSVQWAGPADIRSQAKRGVTIQGTAGRKGAMRVTFGFAADDVAYEIAIGLPIPSPSRFSLDPEIKSECVWSGPPRRASNTWLEREGMHVSVRESDGKRTRLEFSPSPTRSVMAELGEPERFPELFALRERIRRWRFYDGFRTDAESPLRLPRVAVRTEVLAHDGRDLAAALQTILEIGDTGGLQTAITSAFPGSELEILGEDATRLQVGLRIDGLLRPLAAAELSDGTLRYLCLLAALMSPRPPELLVLNEPEQSLHPDLLAPLAEQIHAASQRGQVWVISHSHALVDALATRAGIAAIELVREYGETRIAGQGLLDEPPWP